MDFTSNAIRTEASDFVHLGLLYVNAPDVLRSFVYPATRFGGPTDGFNYSAPSNIFGEVIVIGMSGTRSEQNNRYKTDFETRRENQDFGRQNISMSQPPLDSTTFGTNITNRTMSPIDSISIREKTLDPTQLTQQMDFPTRPM